MKKTVIFLFAITILFSTISCTSTPNLSTDLTQAQLIQKGQDAYGVGDYKTAELYYQTSIQRYGNNTENYIESKYELGHLYLKTKDYDKAKSAFDEILELYEYAAIGDLPPAYKKLAQIGLSKLPENKVKSEKETQD